MSEVSREGVGRRMIAALLAVGLLAALPAVAAGATGDVVQVGPGGYLIRPGGKGSPFLAKGFRGHPPTTQWFSNLVFRGKSAERQYGHPLGFRPTAGGLKIHNPGPYINSGQAAIMGGMPDKAEWLLTCSEGGTFEDVLLEAASDWFIAVGFTTAGKGMHAAYGHGSPFVYATFDGGGAGLTAGGAVKVWAGSEKDPILGVTVGRSHYGLFGPTGSTWTISGNKLANDGRGKGYFSLAVLPDATPQTLALFARYAHNHVTDTRMAWAFDPASGEVRVSYTFATKAHEGQAAGTIAALYPHQWKYADPKLTTLTKLEYPSVRGAMKVAVGASFATATPIQGVLPMLPPQGIADKARLLSYLRQEKLKGQGYKDTYWEGKFLGRLATMCQIAELLGEKDTRQECLAELKRRLEEWFTVRPGKSAQVFAYNPAWGTLVGYPPSYGSEWPFNDHHFHYGYFIRAAAEVARCDPAWAKQWAGMVNLLIRDFASGDRNDRLFPYLRCFDRYAGHSWASGDAGFADGNNQESSSESMNAWYGVLLWGLLTGDKALADLGLFLYTTEMTAVEEYWFDVADTNFPKDYPHEAVGMCWGGKGAWGTWFSGNADCIHGINWLPFTPGSVYLLRHGDYVRRAYQSVMAARQDKGDLTKGWGDLVVMFRAGGEPAEAAAFADANLEAMKIEAGNSRAFLYHWVHTLDTLGRIDRTITADYPIYNVYSKAGKKTYVVYNLGDRALTVKFSDGTKLDAPARGFATR